MEGVQESSHLLLKLSRGYRCFLNTGNFIIENPQAVADFRAWKGKALNSTFYNCIEEESKFISTSTYALNK